MSSYFKSFPKIKWNNLEMVDISRRVSVIQKLSSDPYLFLPYDIQEGDSPESIALYYYGDSKYSWLVYLANNIIDPYTDFFKGEKIFNDFVIDKYAVEAQEKMGMALTRQKILEWTQNATRQDNIVYYYSQYDKDVHISVATYNKFSTGEWFALRYYEYEELENEKLRSIKLISERYVSQIERDMKALING